MKLELDHNDEPIIPTGYKRLSKGEKLQAGDLFPLQAGNLFPYLLKWAQTECVGAHVYSGTYIRKVPASEIICWTLHIVYNDDSEEFKHFTVKDKAIESLQNLHWSQFKRCLIFPDTQRPDLCQ